MRIKSNRKIRLHIKIKLYSEGELLEYSSTIKSRIFDFVQGRSFSKGVCRVGYNLPKHVWNEFEFNNLAQFRLALSADTELDLLKYVAEGQW